MIFSVLLLAAGTAVAAPSPKAAPRHTEETLRVKLFNLRRNHEGEVRHAVIGAAEELRDAVAAGEGAAKEQFADRLPGMAKDPFGICRDLRGCPEAPTSLHVEDSALVDDAFLALARPWFKLQKERGKAVTVDVDPGTGVVLKLEDFAARPVVALEATPTPTGGFDVTMDDGIAAAKAYAAERSALLNKKKK